MKRNKKIIAFILTIILITNIPINIYAEELQVNQEPIIHEEENIDNDNTQEKQDIDLIEESNITYQPANFTGYKVRILDFFLNYVKATFTELILTKALNWLIGRAEDGGLNSGQVKGPYTKNIFNATLAQNRVGNSQTNLRDRVLDLQSGLQKKKYNPGLIDGYWGTSTRYALTNFQANEKLTIDGICGTNTWMKLVTRSKLFGF